MSLLYPLPFSLRLKYVHILMNIRNDIDRQRQRRKIKICRSVTYQGTYHCLLSALIPVMSKIPDPWWIAFTHGSRNGPMHSHYGHPWVTLHIMPSAVGYLANSCPPQDPLLFLLMPVYLRLSRQPIMRYVPHKALSEGVKHHLFRQKNNFDDQILLL